MTEYVYNYHRETKEYLGKSVLEYDPKGKNPLIPKNATLIQPVEPNSGYAICFENGEWVYKEDHRGQKYWLDGNELEMEQIGELPAGATLEKPFVLEDAQQERIYQLNEYIFSQLSKGFTCSNDIKMDATESSVSRFESGIKIAQMNNESTIDIVDYNNEIHRDVSISDASAMLLELANNGRNYYYHKQDKRREINDSDDPEQVDITFALE